VPGETEVVSDHHDVRSKLAHQQLRKLLGTEVTQGLTEAQQPQVVEAERREDPDALAQAGEARRRIGRQEVLARGGFEGQQHRRRPESRRALPGAREQCLVAEMDPVVGADGHGAARAAPAQACDAPNQLHERTRDMIVKCLILMD
jgi:hypothetical protein